MKLFKNREIQDEAVDFEQHFSSCNSFNGLSQNYAILLENTVYGCLPNTI